MQKKNKLCDGNVYTKLLSVLYAYTHLFTGRIFNYEIYEFSFNVVFLPRAECVYSFFVKYFHLNLVNINQKIEKQYTHARYSPRLKNDDDVFIVF